MIVTLRNWCIPEMFSSWKVLKKLYFTCSRKHDKKNCLVFICHETDGYFSHYVGDDVKTMLNKTNLLKRIRILTKWQSIINHSFVKQKH